MIHTIKGVSVVNEADIFLEFPCFIYDPIDVDNLISGSSAFSKSSLKSWKLMVHILLKPVLENFEHYFASVPSQYKEANTLPSLVTRETLLLLEG